MNFYELQVINAIQELFTSFCLLNRLTSTKAHPPSIGRLQTTKGKFQLETPLTKFTDILQTNDPQKGNTPRGYGTRRDKSTSNITSSQHNLILVVSYRITFRLSAKALKTSFRSLGLKQLTNISQSRAGMGLWIQLIISKRDIDPSFLPAVD